MQERYGERLLVSWWRGGGARSDLTLRGLCTVRLQDLHPWEFRCQCADLVFVIAVFVAVIIVIVVVVAFASLRGNTLFS